MTRGQPYGLKSLISNTLYLFSYEDNLCLRQIGEALGLHRQKRENKSRRLEETQLHLYFERNFYISCLHGQEGKVILED